MANTNNDCNLLNLEETTGSAQVTKIQQSTDVNLFYTKMLQMNYLTIR